MRTTTLTNCLSVRLWVTGMLIGLGAGVTSAAERVTYKQTVEHARARAVRDLNTLESYLARGGEKTLTGWREYLDLSALREELQKPDPDLDRLHHSWAKFHTPQEGLERKAFLDARESLRLYRLAVMPGEHSGEPSAAIATVQNQLEAYRNSDSRDDIHAVGTTLAWLKTAGVDARSIALMRQPVNYPNAYIRVSSRLGNYFLERDVSEQERVTTSFSGATTTGNAVMNGKLWMHTPQAHDHGAVEIRLTGNVRTDDAVTRRGRITIYGNANTSIDARVRLRVTEDAIRADAPVVKARTKSNINDISANLRIIERIAWRRAPREVPAAEQAAARQAEKRLGERLADETSKMVTQANKMYSDNIRVPFMRRGALPELNYSTDGSSLHLKWLQSDDHQVAAPNAPPQWPVAGDLTLAGHESMPENMVESLFGGRYIEDTKFLYMHELMTGESPRPLWVHDREPRWSVRVAEVRPMRIRFRDGRMQMTFAIDETVRGEERFLIPALVTATFRAEATEDGPVLFREGEVLVEFPDREASSEEAQRLHAFLLRKFNAVMPAELYFDGLAAPAGGFGDKLNQLRIQAISFAHGWTTIQYALDLSRTPQQQLVSTRRGLGQ